MYNQMSVYPDNITNDIYLDNHSIARCYESEAVRQNVKERLLTIREEWFLNLEQGLPWFTELHGRNVALETVRVYVVECVTQTAGVLELLSVDVNAIGGRVLVVTLEYRDIYGNITKIDLG